MFSFHSGDTLLHNNLACTFFFYLRWVVFIQVSGLFSEDEIIFDERKERMRAHLLIVLIFTISEEIAEPICNSLH